MKKIAFFTYALLIIALLSTVIVFSANYLRLSDKADLLSDSEAQYLSSELDSVSEEYDLDIVIHTVNSLGGKNIDRYAENAYLDGNYSSDGIILLIAIDERAWAVRTFGEGRRRISDSDIDSIMSVVTSDYLSSDDYYGGFFGFTEQCKSRLSRGGDYYDDAYYTLDYESDDGSSSPGIYIIIALVIGLLTAVIATAIMKNQLKSVRAQRTASSYIKNGSFNLTVHRDLYLYSTVTRTPRPKNNNSSSSRSGGRSGRF